MYTRQNRKFYLIFNRVVADAEDFLLPWACVLFGSGFYRPGSTKCFDFLQWSQNWQKIVCRQLCHVSAPNNFDLGARFFLGGSSQNSVKFDAGSVLLENFGQIFAKLLLKNAIKIKTILSKNSSFHS